MLRPMVLFCLLLVMSDPTSRLRSLQLSSEKMAKVITISAIQMMKMIMMMMTIMIVMMRFAKTLQLFLCSVPNSSTIVIINAMVFIVVNVN